MQVILRPLIRTAATCDMNAKGDQPCTAGIWGGVAEGREFHSLGAPFSGKSASCFGGRAECAPSVFKDEFIAFLFLLPSLDTVFVDSCTFIFLSPPLQQVFLRQWFQSCCRARGGSVFGCMHWEHMRMLCGPRVAYPIV